MSERPSFKVEKTISRMTALTAHLETSFSTHVNPVRRETVEVDGFVSALTAVSWRHLQAEQGVIWVQQSIVRRLFGPRESSAQTLQSFTPAQTSPSPTRLLYANLSQYTIKLSLKTFSTNDDGQEMIAVRSKHDQHDTLCHSFQTTLCNWIQRW